MKLLIIGVALLSGCATTDYKDYTSAQLQINVAKSNADKARYEALARVAETGNESAKVAAVMALALGSNSSVGQASTLQAPAPNEALQWASILVPGLTQIYGIRANANVAMRASDNAAATSIATTEGFVNMSGKIQAPGNTTSYVYGANSGTNSGNSGRLAGTSITDATSVPTIVLQPAPTIVTQPAPVIVTQPAPVIVP